MKLGDDDDILRSQQFSPMGWGLVVHVLGHHPCRILRQRGQTHEGGGVSCHAEQRVAATVLQLSASPLDPASDLRSSVQVQRRPGPALSDV